MPPTANHTINTFLNDLAAAQPTPGGGAAASIIAATAAALATMVVNYARGKTKYAEFADQHHQAIAHLTQSRADFLALADRDAQAYATLNAAFARPKDDPKRAHSIAEAATHAIAVPLDAMHHSADLIERLASLRTCTSSQLASDLTIAAITAEAACRAFQLLVNANTPYLADPAAADQATHTAQAHRERAAAALCQFTETP